jgi:type VI secretion system protein ImpH
MADHDRTAPPAVKAAAGAAPPAQPSAPAGEPASAERAEALLRALEKAPYEFDFLQALRRLECLYRDHPRWGAAQRPSDEPVRLGQEVSLSAAPATLARFVPATHDQPARLSTYFFGVLGPDGPMPLHLTDYAGQRLRHSNDDTLVRFLDMFHHRLLSLFYRAHSSGDPTTQRDRPESDRFLMYLGSLLGLGLPAVRERDAFPDHAKLYYAGLLSAQTRNASGLRAMIEDFMQMPTRVEEFVGEWVTIPPAHCWHLGQRARRGVPLLGQLGKTALVGTRVWMRQHRFRVVLGPLRRDQFRSMLPAAPGSPERQGLARLTALVRNYIGDELAWDVRLQLRRDAIQALELGVNAQLGRTTWISSRAGSSDWEDLVLDPAREDSHSVGAGVSRPAGRAAMQGAQHV